MERPRPCSHTSRACAQSLASEHCGRRQGATCSPSTTSASTLASSKHRCWRPARPSRSMRSRRSAWASPAGVGAFAEFADEGWCRPTASRLEELRLTAEEQRCQALLDLGRHGDATAELERLVAEHPLRDRFRGQLMLALHRSGRQVEALRAFQAYRHYLADEAGLEPTGELVELDQRIAISDPSLHAVATGRAARLRLDGHTGRGGIRDGLSSRPAVGWTGGGRQGRARIWRTTRRMFAGSRAKRGWWPGSSTRTSCPCTTSGVSQAARTSCSDC